jgi:hypothetical protein
LKISNIKRADRVAQVVEPLLSKCEALSPNSSSAKKLKKNLVLNKDYSKGKIM